MDSRELCDVLAETGPLTGAELLERTGQNPLPLWRLCRQTPGVARECIGTRYLRLDRAVTGFARLSPSIRREFLTYTLLGLDNQRAAIAARADQLRADIRQVSEEKFQVARDAMESATGTLTDGTGLADRVAFLLAGDITYGMAHAVPRPERSTGRMVRGSDLDVIVITATDLGQEVVKKLDAAIYAKKHFLLVHPAYQEEIDYLIKDLDKVRAQLAFDTFEHMVASKILVESRLLLGSPAVYDTVKAMVRASGVSAKLAELEATAASHRLAAEASLLAAPDNPPDNVYLNLFFTREEGDEIY